MNKLYSACLSLLAEHICASVYMIECCLTALTRKPHAKHHRGDASPAESEFLAHSEIYGIQACTCKSSMQAISPIVSSFDVCLFLQSSVCISYRARYCSSATFCQCFSFPVVRSPHKRQRHRSGHTPQDTIHWSPEICLDATKQGLKLGIDITQIR